MAIGLGFCKKPYLPTAVGTKKNLFLLVPSFAGPVLSGLWVSKENEQDHWRKTHGLKNRIPK
jgi:hypothetical protein